MTVFSFTTLDALVPFAKMRAQRGLYDGRGSPGNQILINTCTHKLQINPEIGAVVIFTRDIGHHTSGWWKNPDYERCLHLSISYRQHHEGAHAVDRWLPQSRDRSERIADAFFGDDARLCWVEPPYSPEGKAADVWHYRLFCDPSWKAFKPRGEVYDRSWTPAGWKSFSEVHGVPVASVDAPFLTATSESGS